jgi:hypothetical protein
MYEQLLTRYDVYNVTKNITQWRKFILPKLTFNIGFIFMTLIQLYLQNQFFNCLPLHIASIYIVYTCTTHDKHSERYYSFMIKIAEKLAI